MTGAAAHGPIEILLVEDSEADVELTRELFLEAKVPNRIGVVGDGDAALAYLRREGKWARAPRPDIVLLDINLPGRSGLEVLTEIKADRDLCTIPVIVLTTSTSDTDVLAAYERHVNSYVRKPLGVEQSMQVVRAIEDFWLTIARLPPGQARPRSDASRVS